MSRNYFKSFLSSVLTQSPKRSFSGTPKIKDKFVLLSTPCSSISALLIIYYSSGYYFTYSETVLTQ